jgi:hypothetical protein
MERSSKQTGSSKSAKPIHFRPAQEVYDLLESRAKALGLSVHDLACHYVTQTVRGKDAAHLSADPVLALLEELREDVAVSVEALLASAGKRTEEEARNWTDKNLRE